MLQAQLKLSESLMKSAEENFHKEYSSFSDSDFD